MRLPYDDVHLIADPLYGYIRITVPRETGEVAEADLIDNPWVQRLKRIHQLQSAWWVFPTAEHSRFTHCLGVMHLAGELARQVYPTLSDEEAGTPSLAVVEETLRLAGLLHDVGHGPFSHFFDEEYLHPRFGLDHEKIGQHLIVHELGDQITALRRSPSGAFAVAEHVDPEHVAYLIRLDTGDWEPVPRWVALLRAALSGAITVDNMDYVRRDAYMCGVATGRVDVDRLLYYLFVTGEGLTFHKRALGALRAFLNARFYMYENVYFHRIGRAIDLHLREIFQATMRFVLARSPLDDLASYQRLTEWSLFDQVERWLDTRRGSEKHRLAEQWQAIIHRNVKYRMVFEQSVERTVAPPGTREWTRDEFRAAMLRRLAPALGDIPFEVDIASQDPRPLNPMHGPKRLPVYDPSTGRIEEQLLTGILEFVPAKAHLYRVFAPSHEHDRELGEAARRVLADDSHGEASLTNL